MAKNRQAAQAMCLKLLNELCPKNPNIQIYQDLFASMSDKAFDDFMTKLREKSITLSYIEPNLSKGPRLTTKGNLDFLTKYKVSPFKRIWITNSDGSRTLSNFKYMVVPLPVRRQAQILVEKISIPESNRVVDDISSQPTGPSKGSKISYPQQSVLDTLGLQKTLEEFNYYRSGDIKGYAAMNEALLKGGSVKMANIAQHRSGVEAVKAWSVFLKGAHLGNNLV